MSYHVLIVDDDPAICKLLSKVMVSNEMEPLVVNSGAAALDLIARQSSTLDMILMDITLGDMEGFDVIQTIRRNGVTTPGHHHQRPQRGLRFHVRPLAGG